MTMPKFYETFIPILEILSVEKEPLHHSELREKISKKYFWDNLTEEEKKEKVKTGRSLISDRIGWGAYYLKMGNFVYQPKKGYFMITEKGRDWIKKNKKLDFDILKNDPDYIEYKKNVEKNKKVEKEIDSDNNFNNEITKPIEKVRSGIQELEFELKRDVLEKLKTTNPYYFEKIILKLFKKMGYGDFETTKKSGDGGIDGIIKQDALGIDKIYTQAKRYTTNNVGERDIRNFKGAMDDGEVDKGIFVTTSDFDEKAKESAKNSRNKIILINGKKLADLMVKYELGIESREKYLIKQIDEDFFLDDDE